MGDNGRCGYAAIIGRPNAGKSTFFNTALGQRFSIVTSKPQTTRSRIVGVLTRGSTQTVFLDTPGLLEPSYRLHHFMVGQAERSATEADVALLLVDGTRPFDRFDLVADLVGRLHVPLIAAINKIDKVPLERLSGMVEEVRSRLGLDEVLTMSALRGQQVNETLDQLEQRLPLGPKLYPDDMIAEQPERFFVAEFIRQAAFDQLTDELPYSIEVAIDEFRDAAGPDKTYIHATLFVERESQKGIVIGRKASRLRSIGSAARTEVETLLDRPVFLDLRVKVRPDWRDKDRDLKEFGYGQ